MINYERKKGERYAPIKNDIIEIGSSKIAWRITAVGKRCLLAELKEGDSGECLFLKDCDLIQESKMIYTEYT